MIQANEIRLGNWYYFEEFVAPYFQWRESDFGYLDKDMIEPIPLTPTTLEKAGFEQTDRFYSQKDVLLLFINPIAYYYRSSLSDARIEIRYVHQLQNLYFALTGTELIIDLWYPLMNYA